MRSSSFSAIPTTMSPEDLRAAGNIELIDFIKDFSGELLTLIETLASSAEESAAISEEVTASSENQIIVVQNVKSESDNIDDIVDSLQVSIEKFKVE